MTWYPDMGTETMVDVGNHVRSVGWLSAEHSFPLGDVPTDFLSRLRELAKNWTESASALGWGFFMGSHRCDLCDMGPPPWRRFRTHGNFGVLCGELLFVAPEMISHYVEVHRYRPPHDFIVAVMASPMPGTEAYQVAAEPFRRLHQKYLEWRGQQWLIWRAAHLALQLGGSEAAIREAAVRCLREKSPAICERIRRAMPTAGEVLKENRT